MQEETARAQRQLGQAGSLLCTALGGESAWNTLLHSHSHLRPPPSQAISFQTQGFEATRQKSRDCLVSGDRETQGTESIVTQAWEEILFSGPRWSRVSHHTKEIKSLFSNYKCHLISIIYISQTKLGIRIHGGSRFSKINFEMECREGDPHKAGSGLTVIRIKDRDEEQLWVRKQLVLDFSR